jgi:FMN phosphatase YigB (HAD superfamily)
LTSLKKELLAVLPAPLAGALRAARRRFDRTRWRVPVVRSLEELVGRIDDADVISCDLFDTLVERDVEPPELLARSSAELAERILGGAQPGLERSRILSVRREVETRLRRAASARGDDAECTLEEVVQETLFVLIDRKAAAEHSARLIAHELDVERRHLRAAKGAVGLLAALARGGRRVVVTSDTYFERPQARALLESVGLASAVDELYLSSEHGLGKVSGRLFLRLLERERVKRERVVHFGDSFEADVRGARRAGIRAVLLDDEERRKRRREIARASVRLAAAGEWQW